MAKTKQVVPELVAQTEALPPAFPDVMALKESVKRACDHVVSESFIEYPEYRGRGPIFHAHVFLDRREYLISIVPTDLDGPDAR